MDYLSCDREEAIKKNWDVIKRLTAPMRRYEVTDSLLRLLQELGIDNKLQYAHIIRFVSRLSKLSIARRS